MVKVFYLGLFAAIICAFAVSYASAGPVPSNFRQHPLLHHHQLCNGSHCQPPQQRFLRHSSSNNQEVAYAEDGTVRSERSTNLSHITGSARKIQMFVKNWHLQILPDGVVNGTQDDSSDYTILQRTTVNIGQLKIQGVATCQYLCMDSCGLLYASALISHRVSPLDNNSNIHGHRIRMNMKNLKWTTEKDFVDECIFNEMIEQHHYNTYSSVHYSNARKTLYIALNRYGSPRRVQIRAQQQLGKLSTYARVLTKTVSLERVEDLLSRIGNATGSHPLRHHGGLQTCTSVIEQKAHNSDWQGVDRLRCRKRKKRKKKRRRCDKQQEDGGNTEGCPINNNNKNKKKNNNNNNGEVVKKNLKNVKNSDKKKLCEHDNKSKRCQRLGGKSDLVTVKRKKKKQLNANRNTNNNKKKNNQKTLRNNNNNPNNNNNNNNNDNNNNSNSNNNRKIVKKVLPVFEEDNDNTTITSASVEEETSSAEESSLVEETSVLEESSTMDESTTMTSAMEDSEQNYDDGGSVASTTHPSAEVD